MTGTSYWTIGLARSVYIWNIVILIDHKCRITIYHTYFVQLKLKRIKQKEKKLDPQNSFGSFINPWVCFKKGCFLITNWICNPTFFPIVALPKKCRTISGCGHLIIFPSCKFLEKITGQSGNGCLNISNSCEMQVSKFYTLFSLIICALFEKKIAHFQTKISWILRFKFHEFPK